MEHKSKLLNMDVIESHEDYDNEDDGCTDDDSSLLVHVPLLQSSSELVPKILEQPPAGFEWNDTAILDCFELAVKSHDQNHHIHTETQSDKNHHIHTETQNDNGDDNNSNNNRKDNENPTNFEWYPPTQNPSNGLHLSSWQPKRLPLPLWAKDSMAELFVDKQKEPIPK